MCKNGTLVRSPLKGTTTLLRGELLPPQSQSGIKKPWGDRQVSLVPLEPQINLTKPFQKPIVLFFSSSFLTSLFPISILESA
mmetsp:Transcript_87420/g.152221  ORF Transcript_87420/g.152221 Transcript_87420/m.152221 type:complete len:82 (+) Transcript_87420:235-480(+)